MNDHRDVALVFDMRSQIRHNVCKLNKSINFPIETTTDDKFFNWSKYAKSLETDTTQLKDKHVRFAFSKRKRHWVFIIGAHSTKNVTDNIMKMTEFCSKERIGALVAAAETDQ